jgi:hypothetical protein
MTLAPLYNSRNRSLLTALTACLLVTATAAARAGTACPEQTSATPAAGSVLVSYADLNLATDAGVRALYQLDGGYTPGPLLALFTLAGLAGSAAVARRRADPGTRQLALACLLFSTTALSVLLISDLFEFSWRYQLPALVTLPPAGALGIAVIISSIRARRSPG